MTMVDLPWRDVQPLPALNGDLASVLASVQSLRGAWKAVIAGNDRAFQGARQRSLRRHAIETGIIERLYDIDWGVTEALVAEGITSDAVARAGDGSVPEDVLAVIRSQYDALQFMAETARDGRDVSISLIRELHAALTRCQLTYSATDSLGRPVQAHLHHGEWKRQPNHVTRQDGSTLWYTPPEHVDAAMYRLVELYLTYDNEDPIVRAAWLHHRFVRIHPFADGNGRVARCLTLLGLLRADLAPLVVDRRERERYLRCLDQANDGDLRPLVRFFAELEIVALRSELERPVESAEVLATGGGALAVLDASINRLRELKGTNGAADRASAVASLAEGIQQRIRSWLDNIARQMKQRLTDEVDVRAHASVAHAAPPDPRSRYWHRQVVSVARSVDFFANIHDGVWWTRLQLSALDQRLRYLVFLQKAGRGESGVLTMTVYAEILSPSNDEEPRSEAERVVESSPTETVTWTWTDTPDRQWDSVEEVLDRTLAAAIAHFTTSLG